MNIVPNKVMFYFYMLSPRMQNWISRETYGRSVITKYNVTLNYVEVLTSSTSECDLIWK